MPSSPQTLITQVVFDYLYDTAGKPVVGARVSSTLNFAGASDTNPIVNIGPLTQVTTTDSNGYWQFSLVPNPALTPTGTSYTIDTPYNTYSISVPNSAGPFQSSSILVNAPSVISPALTGLTGPITVTGSETITGNLTVSGTTTLDGTTTGALSTTANSGIGGDLTILSPGRLLFTALVGKIVPGATSLSHRNNADSADNLLITDAGAVTVRNGLTVSAGNLTVGSGIAIVPLGGVQITASSTSGPPTSGTFALGQLYLDSKEGLWVCNTAGTPGTWLYVGGGPYHAEVYQNTTQTITNATFTVVAYDTIESDPNANFTTGSGAHYTCPLTGRYLVSGAVNYGGGSTSNNPATLAIFKNGAENRRFLDTVSSVRGIEGAAVVRASASDTLDLRAYQQSGGSLNTSALSTATYAEFTFLGA